MCINIAVASVMRFKPVFMRTFLTLFVLVCATACTEDRWGNPVNNSTLAYVPQYMTLSDVRQISVQAARSTQQAGKIYAFGNYLFQSDPEQGIHIIDNTDRKKPVKLAFLKVPFSTEIAIKGKYLYTNNLNDMVVFDLSDVQAPRLVKRMEKMFPTVNQKYPSFTNVSFECPDPAKGLVVKWELKNSTNAQCRR